MGLFDINAQFTGKILPAPNVERVGYVLFKRAFFTDMLEKFWQPAIAEAYVLGFIRNIVADELLAELIP